MKNYYVTVEGLVSRVMCVEADNVAKAMECAKADFKSAVGADNAVVVAANEEKKLGDNDESRQAGRRRRSRGG
jgi:hypothetical protein